MTIPPMKIGSIIRKRRHKANMTIQDLANKIDWDTGNISRVEKDKQRIANDKIGLIAEALGCQPYQLFLDPDIEALKNDIAVTKNNNVNQSYKLIPLLDSDDILNAIASGVFSMETIDKSKVKAYRPCFEVCSEKTFAHTVQGDSMQGHRLGLADGMEAFVDPEAKPKHKDVVLAYVGERLELGEFHVHGDKIKLIPTNNRFDAFDIRVNQIIGVVIGAYISANR